jgi:monoamine oxidase
VAYDLGKVGYDCRVLEGRARPGGRVFTVRRGTVSEEDGAAQTAAFDEGLYFNAGPMRISHHHHTTLGYCRELRVPVEVFVPDCESAYLFQTRGTLAVGQLIYPSHGFNGGKGMLVGYFLDFKRTMGERPPAECQRLALEQGGRIHPQYASEFETAFSVSWPRVPWSRGSWRSESEAAHGALNVLRQPDGRVHFGGDYMTDMSSWMQGAFESAREVATAIHKRALTRG